jgi:hypothetical protein
MTIEGSDVKIPDDSSPPLAIPRSADGAAPSLRELIVILDEAPKRYAHFLRGAAYGSDSATSSAPRSPATDSTTYCLPAIA